MWISLNNTKKLMDYSWSGLNWMDGEYNSFIDLTVRLPVTLTRWQHLLGYYHYLYLFKIAFYCHFHFYKNNMADMHCWKKCFVSMRFMNDLKFSIWSIQTVLCICLKVMYMEEEKVFSIEQEEVMQCLVSQRGSSCCSCAYPYARWTRPLSDDSC
jgi:hypothetical protein